MIGYKVALEEDGKFYSIMTGIEYKPNTKIQSVLTEADVDKEHSTNFFKLFILDPDSNFYDKDLVGRTKVFKERSNAESLYREVKKFSSKNIVLCEFTYNEYFKTKKFKHADTVFCEMIKSDVDLIDEFQTIKRIR